MNSAPPIACRRSHTSASRCDSSINHDREQDVLKSQDSVDQYASVMYEDGIGCWQFEFDYHPTGRAFLPSEGPSGPWEGYGKPGRGWGPYSDRALLPAGSLVPERVDGLLGSPKEHWLQQHRQFGFAIARSVNDGGPGSRSDGGRVPKAQCAATCYSQ